MSDELRCHRQTEPGGLFLPRQPYLKWKRHRPAPPTPATHQHDHNAARDALDMLAARQRARQIREQEQAEERRRTIASASLRQLVAMAKQDLARLSAKRRAEVLAEPKGAASPK